MKKTFLWMAAILFMGCENAIVGDGEFTDERMVEFSFSLDGTTRALPAEFFNKLHMQLFNDDGSKVFAQVKTQNIDDANFGTFSVGVPVGSYTVVAVGHSSARSATLSSPQQVQFTASNGEKLTDTFSYCGRVEVSEGGTHNATMQRVCAMVRFRFTDETMPDNFAKLKIDYTGGSANFNPSTMQGCTKSTQTETRQRADVYECFTFPYMAESGQLKMTISALTADDVVLHQRVLTDVPVTRNHITTYTGPFFGEGSGQIVQTGFTITVNGEWDGSHDYSF